MARLSIGSLRRQEDERLAAGVCAGIAVRLRTDPTLVRLAFVALTLAGGMGVVLYLALWLVLPGSGSAERSSSALPLAREGFALAALMVAVLLALRAAGLAIPDAVLWPGALVVAGAALLARGERRTSSREVALRIGVGAILLAAGVSLLIGIGEDFEVARQALLAAIVVSAGLALLLGPWAARLVRERDAERAERIRSQERAEMAARVHDSVLQGLALIQRHAGDPRRVSSLARRQERELRDWLYGERPPNGTADSLVTALQAAAAEVEELHAVRVELAHSGDLALDERLEAVVLAAREAMTNAAKFSGADSLDVYVEVAGEGVAVWVRDRGTGFDPAAVASDRRGVRESIVGRMKRAGGTATIGSAPGKGTEVELRLEHS